jgi:hypothetical protein
MSNRVFTSRYRAGVFFSPGRGLLIVPFLFLPGMTLFKSALVAGVFALAAFIGATWFWTRRRKASPALVLSDSGAMIDGLPQLEWRQIVSVRRHDGRLDRPQLEISLATPIKGARASPLFELLGSNRLLLRAYLLADRLEEVEDAFNFFLPRPAIS